jgi:hypothetical protein
MFKHTENLVLRKHPLDSKRQEKHSENLVLRTCPSIPRQIPKKRVLPYIVDFRERHEYTKKDDNSDFCTKQDTCNNKKKKEHECIKTLLKAIEKVRAPIHCLVRTLSSTQCFHIPTFKKIHGEIDVALCKLNIAIAHVKDVMDASVLKKILVLYKVIASMQQPLALLVHEYFDTSQTCIMLKQCIAIVDRMEKEVHKLKQE